MKVSAGRKDNVKHSLEKINQKPIRQFELTSGTVKVINRSLESSLQSKAGVFCSANDDTILEGQSFPAN